jgi:ABC-type uncharacterized transport system involved in gliding motility auxiliary subunit
MNKKHTALAGFGVAIAGFLAINALARPALVGVRLDITEDSLYTLSPGAREILRQIGEPVRLELYYTEETGRAVPQVHTYAQRVKEFLAEIAAVAGESLEIRIVNPEPFSEEEDAARAAGLSRISADQAGGSITFGLIGSNSVDREEVIAFLDPQTEAFLEYDVMRLLQGLSNAEKPKVALVSGVPMEPRFDPANPGRPSQGWLILDLMKQLFDLETVQPAAETLPEGTDVLMLAHPKGLSEGLLKAIDAYALGGGDMLILLDPYCESDPSGGGGQQNPFMPQQGSPAYSDLGPLLAAWGVNWSHEEFVGDEKAAVQVPTRDGRGPPSVKYIAYQRVTTDNGQIAEDDPLTLGLESVLFAVPGRLASAEGATTRLVPLLRSTKEAALIPTSRLEFGPDPEGLLRAFVPDQREHVIAARLEGTLKSAYPAEDGSVREGQAGGVVLIADADFLADPFWVDARFVPMGRPPMAVMDNGSLVLNALETLGGNPALMGLRGRGTHTRPFVRVEELRGVADERYRAEQEALQAEISASEAEIVRLQGEGGGDLILTPEVEAELGRLDEEILGARKELRAVEYNLRKDIDGLGRDVMLLNVIGVPLGAALLVLGWTLHRNRKR